MELKKKIPYRVTKGNTDGSIQKGDLIYVDDDGDITVNSSGAIEVCDQNKDIMDFEAVIDDNYKVVHIAPITCVVKIKPEANFYGEKR